MNFRALLRSACCGLLAAVAVAGARAEKADRTKPTQIEANRMSSDDARRMSIFEGNVVLTKGTLVVRADRIVVRQDAEGYQFATATGAPVRFRQRGDARGGREAVWTDGEAQRIEIDDRNEHVNLFERARLTRDKDVVNGEHIFLDQRTEFFAVNSAKGAAPTEPSGRVTVVIQPKVEAAKPEPAKPAPEKPAPR